MASLNGNFTIPSESQSTKPQSVAIVQYRQQTGNLPLLKSYHYYTSNDEPLLCQGFTATDTQIKAISIYFDSNITGDTQDATVRLTLYEESSVAGSTITWTKKGSVDLYLFQVNDRDETIFEFDEPISTTSGTNYYIVIQRFGVDVFYLQWGNDGRSYNTAMNGYAYSVTNYTDTSATLTSLSPVTNFLFRVYTSVSDFAAELTGAGGSTLSDIYDSVTIPSSATYHAGKGIVDFVKPFSSHATLNIASSGTITSDCTSAASITWSTSSSAITLSNVYDNILITVDNRCKVNWADGTADTSTVYRVLEAGQSITIPEYVNSVAFALVDAADTPPNVYATLWKVV